MDSVDLHEFLATARIELEAREAKAQQLYYSTADDDEPVGYCRECFFKAYPLTQEYGIARWDESDTCEHCEACGVLLEYVLTSHGVQSELDHFDSEGCGWDWANAEDCAHIGRTLGGVIGWGAFDAEEVAKDERLMRVLRAGKNPPESIAAYLPLFAEIQP